MGIFSQLPLEKQNVDAFLENVNSIYIVDLLRLLHLDSEVCSSQTWMPGTGMI